MKTVNQFAARIQNKKKKLRRIHASETVRLIYIFIGMKNFDVLYCKFVKNERINTFDDTQHTATTQILIINCKNERANTMKGLKVDIKY